MKSNQAFICQSSVKEWGYCFFEGLIAGRGKEIKDLRAQRGREQAFLRLPEDKSFLRVLCG